jgi:6-phosphogluconolactonase
MTNRNTRREFLKELALGLTGTIAANRAFAGLRIRTASDTARFFAGTYAKESNEGIYSLRLDLGSGAITVESAVNGITNPSYLVIDRIRGRLFSVNEVSEFEGKAVGAVTAFALYPETGKLRLVNSRATGGPGPCYVSIDSTGRFVLVANYTGGSVAVLPVQDDGSLGEASDFVQHTGSSVTPRQEGPHAHCVVLASNDRFAYVADLGLDRVMIYQFDGRQGKLLPATPSWAGFKPGAGPRHIAFSPDGASAYVVNELDSTLTVFAADRVTGTLEHRQTVSTLPAGFAGENFPADIHVCPSGQFVYCSNRGHNSIAGFAVNSERGIITPLLHEPTGGKWPRNFAIDPTGQYLLVANQRSDTITVFSIDPQSGALCPTGATAEVPRPACVKFLS